MTDPRSREVCYVGKAINPKERFRRHINEAQSGQSQKCRWIRSLLSVGVAPQLHILEVVRSDQWDAAEKRWIAHGRKSNWPLTNATAGGQDGRRSEKKSFRNRINRILGKCQADGAVDRVVRRIIGMALKGNMNAITYTFDMLFGKPPKVQGRTPGQWAMDLAAAGMSAEEIPGTLNLLFAA